MAPRQRHLTTQPSLQDDISPPLVVVGSSGAPVTVHVDDDNDTLSHDGDNDKHICNPLLIVGNQHRVSLVETTTSTTNTPIYPNEESSYNTSSTERLRDRHDIFNIIALVSLYYTMVLLFWLC
jgi:hypothetical protein